MVAPDYSRWLSNLFCVVLDAVGIPLSSAANYSAVGVCYGKHMMASRKFSFVQGSAQAAINALHTLAHGPARTEKQRRQHVANQWCPCNPQQEIFLRIIVCYGAYQN